MSSLSFALLGLPHVYHAQRVLKFPTRKALALLLYVVAEKGTHTRQQLAALLWPESDEERSRTSLRTALLHVRHALTELGPASLQQHLRLDGQYISFDFDSDVHVDVHTLHHAWEMSRSLARATAGVDSAERLRIMQQIRQEVDLIRGSFLSGFSLYDAAPFDEWVLTQRQHWDICLAQVLTSLAQFYEDSGEDKQALEMVTRLLALDPLQEEANQRLMRLHSKTGDTVGALQAYETYARLLASELHTQPSSAMLSFAASLRTTPPTASSVHISSSSHAVLRSLGREGAFVGREQEWRVLIEQFERARLGQTQAVLVSGEAGIGKTRLVTEFFCWAAINGADVLAGQAFETEGHWPYQLLVEVFRSRLERENALDDIVGDVWLAELSRVLPTIRERYPDLPAPLSDEMNSRARLLEAFARLGQALAARAPLVVVLEDMHWADTASRDMLVYLARFWTERALPILIVCTSRREEPYVLRTWLSTMSRVLSFRHILLEPLEEQETLRMLQSFQRRTMHDVQFGQDTSIRRINQWLYAQTAGQPFYFLETFKMLLEHVSLEYPAHSEVGIDFHLIDTAEIATRGKLPSTVQSLIRSRVHCLSSSALTFLNAATVLGQKVQFEWLCHIADVSRGEGLLALDELQQRFLLRETEKAESGNYTFTHDMIREVVYNEMGEARRQLLHTRAFNLLQSHGAPSQLLAYHAVAANLIEPAFSYSLQAGDEALCVFAVDNAIAHYEQARQYIHRDTRFEPDPFSMQHILSLCSQLGRAYEMKANWKQAWENYKVLLTYAHSLHEPTLAATALNYQAMLAARHLHDLPRAQAKLKKACVIVEASSDRVLLAELEANRADLIASYILNSKGARVHAERALKIARELGHLRLIMRCLQTLLRISALDEEWEQCSAYATEALACLHIQSDALVQTPNVSPPSFEETSPVQKREAALLKIEAFSRLATEFLHVGQLQKKNAVLQIDASTTRPAQESIVQITNLFGLGVGMVEVGAYTQALALAQLVVAQANDDLFSRYLALGQLGWTYLALLQVENARQVFEDMRELSEALSFSSYQEVVATYQCVVHALAGDWQEACECAMRATSLRAVRNTPLLLSDLRRNYEIEALLRGGNVEQAQEEVRRFREQIGLSRRYRIPYLRSQAALSLWHKQPEQALRDLQEAAHIARRMGLPSDLWPIQMAIGKCYAVQGKTTYAASVFDDVTGTLQMLAKRIEDEQIRTTFLTTARQQQVAYV